ncbi:UNVERIFIED_ORG: multidrug efflux pump subunit AcrA (membrane-fusion protein) [Rhizobium esperanzae]
MSYATEELPNDLASALALLAQERARRIAAEAEAATAKAEAASTKALVSHSEALIARLKLEIDKVRRELYGSRSERKARLLEQMELQLEELEADAGEDELAAEIVAKASAVKAFERSVRRASPFPSTCRASASLSPLPRIAPAADRLNCQSSARTLPRPWRSSRVNGRSFRQCGRSSLAASARRSRSRQHRSMSRLTASPDLTCWR